jgi:hypothetical protein
MSIGRRPIGVTFDDVRRIAADLPGVEEGTAWGVPALKLRGRFVACMASHKSAEPNTLVVRLDFDQRDALIADAPETYYLKPHYVGYESVLVRLSQINLEALRDLLHASCRFAAAKAEHKRAATSPHQRGPAPKRSISQRRRSVAKKQA